MPKICEICGSEEQLDDLEPDTLKLHVCENCIKDRQSAEEEL